MEIIQQEITAEKSAWTELVAFVLARQEKWERGVGKPEFASYEEELHERLMALERELIGAELKKYDLSTKEIELSLIHI